MRDRLIELIKSSLNGNIDEGFYGPELNCENVADYLLENGVVVPPCKVGDTVYYPWIYDGQCGIAFSDVESIKIYVDGLPIAIVEDWQSDMPMPICFTNDDFGKTVFLTKEEAKAKLKESNDETK